MNESDEVNQAIRDLVRAAVMGAGEIAIALAHHYAAQARLLQHTAETDARQQAQRLRAEYAAARPLLAQPWNATWWRKATPEQIGASWQAAAAWAQAGDPYAHQSLQQLRRELATRYEIPLPADDLPAEQLMAELKAALGDEADAARLRERARDLRAQADQSDETAERLEAEYDDQERARAARHEAAEHRAQAQVDLQVAAAWDAMAERQAVIAADVAAEGFPGRPSERVAAAWVAGPPNERVELLAPPTMRPEPAPAPDRDR
ncbi:hypothetical protein [Nonomuraea typhae]|uniref:hypothetical protein n=1 Tax=Nonomuraea typhae TaxID=2603600 RepID=UPI0012FC8533|nr:hypothetical protein [Nonomuraea typhae]